LTDAIVIGAGFSGAVIAERLATVLGFQVEVLEQRNHVAGNCYDLTDSNGINIHKYGPHFFHTNSEKVWSYLSQFTEWRPYTHKVKARVGGVEFPLPFNFNSIDAVFTAHKSIAIKDLLISKVGFGNRISILELMKQPDPTLIELGNWIYDNVFKNYTARQWGVDIEKIDRSVLERVPVVVSYDDRYFTDKYQALPTFGYTKLVERLLSDQRIRVKRNIHSKKYITIREGVVYRKGVKFDGLVIYTGMLDELFDFNRGELPYRSLKFIFKEIDSIFYQPCATINYPNHSALTRITEFKHTTPLLESSKTVICEEFPQSYDRLSSDKNVPYYPVLTEENSRRFSEYLKQAQAIPNLVALGRLAEYRYLNMDDAILNALQKFDLIANNLASKSNS
jgi:UDP-galactopyranose mutase